jgi:hypothetical protein
MVESVDRWSAVKIGKPYRKVSTVSGVNDKWQNVLLPAGTTRSQYVDILRKRKGRMTPRGGSFWGERPIDISRKVL